MRESTLQKRILHDLNAHKDCKAIALHGDVYQERGTPDILGCFRGRMFLLELKTGRGTVSKIQDLRLFQWARAGAVIAVARPDFSVSDFLDSCF